MFYVVRVAPTASKDSFLENENSVIFFVSEAWRWCRRCWGIMPSSKMRPCAYWLIVPLKQLQSPTPSLQWVLADFRGNTHQLDGMEVLDQVCSDCTHVRSRDSAHTHGHHIRITDCAIYTGELCAAA